MYLLAVLQKLEPTYCDAIFKVFQMWFVTSKCHLIYRCARSGFCFCCTIDLLLLALKVTLLKMFVGKDTRDLNVAVIYLVLHHFQYCCYVFEKRIEACVSLYFKNCQFYCITLSNFIGFCWPPNDTFMYSTYILRLLWQQKFIWFCQVDSHVSSPVWQLAWEVTTDWTVWGSNPGGCNIFRTHPDQVSFLGIKQPGHTIQHRPSCSTEIKERVELCLCSPLGLQGLF